MRNSMTSTEAMGDLAASFRDQLLAEEPKICDGLKSFCSWIVASSSAANLSATSSSKNAADNVNRPSYTAKTTWTLSNALSCTRQLSKAINAHIVPIQYDNKATPVLTPETLMAELSARVWNELAGQTGTKITKVLGRTALKYVWKDLDLTALQSTPEGDAFVQIFAKLLMDDHTTTASDAALVWGGPNVLAQRAAQRQAAAALRVQEEQAKAAERIRQAVSPTIEELPEDEDTEEQDKKPAAI